MKNKNAATRFSLLLLGRLKLLKPINSKGGLWGSRFNRSPNFTQQRIESEKLKYKNGNSPLSIACCFGQRIERARPKGAVRSTGALAYPCIAGLRAERICTFTKNEKKASNAPYALCCLLLQKNDYESR